MTLSRQDALAALHDIEQAEGRATQARGYSRSSPHFIIWGMITLVCYGLADVLPPIEAAWGWTAGSLLGAVGSFYAGRRCGRPAEAWRTLGVLLAVIGFVVAAYLILPPTSRNAAAAFNGLVVAMGYVLLGIWRGFRILITGLAMAALTLGGYFTLEADLQLYMGVVIGGSLILAGLWLRRA